MNFKKVVFCFIAITLFSLLYAQELDSLSASNDISASEFTGNVQIALSNADYMVTAGDVYSLTYVARTTPVSYTIAVDPTYKIRISNLAVLDVSGKSYIGLKKEVEEIVQKNFPMSGVQFVLLNPGSFKVYVNGEVKSAQEKNAWALTRLSSIVSGTKTSYSSIRNIQVVSINGKKNTYDLFKAFRNGDLSQNPYVRPGDKITLSKYNRIVNIQGEVERPGTYELLDGENLSELINVYANGLRPQADMSRVVITKKIDSNYVTGEKIYLTKEEAESNYVLSSYDSVFIKSYAELKPVFFVEGAISNSEGVELDASNHISIQFEPGTYYTDFVRSHKSWFRATSDISNAYIKRGTETIPYDLTPVLFDANYYDKKKIIEGDVLLIPYKQYFVTVSGSVVSPGRYPYIPDRTYEYYVGLAGGFIRAQNAGNAVTITDINGNNVKINQYIEPETNIYAKANSFTYFFNQYAPIITTILSLVLTSISLFKAFGSN